MEKSGIKPLNGLKICFIAGTLGMGGAERQLYLIVSTLIRLGYHVSLICLNTGEFWEKPIRETGVDYYTLSGKGSKITRFAKIIFLLRKLKPDIVQSQHFYTNLYAAICGWFLNIISIGASRSDLMVEVSENGIYGRPSLMWPRYLFVNSMKSFEEALAIGRNKSRLHYLPNALDTTKFTNRSRGLSAKEGPFILIAAGRLIQTKRFDKYIELIKRLNTEHNCYVKGILIGNGIMEEPLKKMVEELGLGTNEIEFISKVLEPEIYLSKADLMVFTSEYEGTPNVVLEAMACGLPVVSTKVGNLPFFIKDGEDGFFFDGSVDNLLEIVMELMNDKELLNKVSKNASQKIENCFSIGVLEINLNHIYSSIVNH